ncbi:AGE family epimerase/isomerase [Asticcacaulis machinosus]|uniref:AGE family epimerase/isomerase n=1 Tax=Asticcacaulis machinosus TaxID=2984211 RepID=A0ABT5HJV7_9CAUL|nr:AGE family epimerase/isomerase [Asticcacaulis machinosus]MDC7676498.1 AGE family epimerase/isomerase [Asticcacaulis machinosus]
MKTVKQIQNEARDWLFGAAAPLWSTTGVLEDGMFAEALHHDGSIMRGPRRLRVQARQIYSFCEIGRLGWDGPWRKIVEDALPAFVSRGVSEEGVFIHTYDDKGDVSNKSLDLYNQAFGLFALAHAGNALSKPELFALAGTVMDRIDADWARPEGGYWEGVLTPCPPYRQNPHMHMFEAATALYRFTNDPRWGAIAGALSLLFRSKFHDRATGAVTEYFDQSWNPLNDETGSIVEPGHCLEWAWLFGTNAKSQDEIDTSDGLSAFARRYGLCGRRGVAINEVSLDGAVINNNARLWPQTERLKAAADSFRRQNAIDSEQEIIAAYEGLAKYLVTDIAGLWHDKMKPDGTFLDEPAPASSFYHIVCGLSELLQLEI